MERPNSFESGIIFSMEIVTTNTQDGIILHGQLFESSNKENIIIHIHGMSGDLYINSFYPAMEKNYPENGWSFLTTENRGTHSVTQFNTTDGRCVNLGNAYEKFEDCIYDIQAWIDKAKDLGYKKIWIQAHSLAPSKVMYYINEKGAHDIQGLIFLSPSDNIGECLSRDIRESHNSCLKEANELQKQGLGSQILRNKLVDCYLFSAGTYINMFGENSNNNIFNYRENIPWDIAKQIRIPLIAFSGTKDEAMVPVIDPYKAMARLRSEFINSPKIEIHVYENGVHDFTGFGEDITKKVLNFIQSK
jgi:hypothetical protein